MGKINFDLLLLYWGLNYAVLYSSLIEFFNKMRKWQDMANLPKEFQQSTEKLERNFTVASVIFKKYVPLFKDIFKAPSDEVPRMHRGRKQRYFRSTWHTISGRWSSQIIAVACKQSVIYAYDLIWIMSKLLDNGN